MEIVIQSMGVEVRGYSKGSEERRVDEVGGAILEFSLLGSAVFP
jgi:hypothetical protein